MKRTALLIASALLAAPVLAAQPAKGGFDAGKVYFGAGISQNDLPGTDEGTGYQFFGGYGIGRIAQNMNLDVEVGYMNSGDLDQCLPIFGCVGDEVKGLWSTGVVRLMVGPEFDLLGRLGLDFGDDDGLMFGVGGGFNVNKQVQLRLEFVERDHLSSLQFNFVYRP